MPSRSFFCVVATRIMKNSSRLVPTIDEELHALEQRMRRVGRLREHALIELEPAQLAVDVQRRVLEVGRDRSRVAAARGGMTRSAGLARCVDVASLSVRRRSATAASRGESISVGSA